MNNKVNVKFDFDISSLMKEMILIKSKVESINYSIKLLLTDEQTEQINQMSEFFLLSNTISAYEQATDFSKDSMEYLKMKNTLQQLDSALVEKGLLKPNI